MKAEVISISELRATLPQVAKQVAEGKSRQIVTIHGKPQMMLVDFNDWSAMAEHFLSQKEMRDVTQSIKDHKEGRVVSLESLLEELEPKA